eukprot:CAMPEP_0168253494 /NCGR_PEP_ID=MMETSP0141_2-20121125/4214_1 /TAXON_ID=44445 /ORGANISM="Pseudo-nitzschia australis, Strain 10249 10 AB" /LENGTH=302 /DNA_ID=CAMNT_0008189857 /DNA_START=84 /DNA_END=989 /DNA_ORIENTATION=+
MRPSYSHFAMILLAMPVAGLQNGQHRQVQQQRTDASRREILGGLASMCGAGLLVVGGAPQPAWSAAAVQDSLDVDAFLRKGVDIGGTMGVSSQAGKSRPETGVFLRDGSEVSRDKKTGDVSAEIVVNGRDGEKMAVFVSYSSPWPLAEGPYYDIECRNQRTSDGAFVQVTTDVGGRTISDIDSSFILENLLAPSGRFSFYGQPTDVRIKKSTIKGDYRIIDLSFATLSQATQTELPRKAQLVATIPKGSSQAIVLVGSAPATRWKKGSDQDIFSTVESFRAIAAPKSSLKLRRKERNTFLID